MSIRFDKDYFNNFCKGYFPEYLGINVKEVGEGKLIGEMPIRKGLFAPNKYLHAGSIVTFADTIAGYSTLAHLPKSGKSFTTLELKSNFVAAAKEGVLVAESNAVHLGKTTHVWEVKVSSKETEKLVSFFSCTQLILY